MTIECGRFKYEHVVEKMNLPRRPILISLLRSPEPLYYGDQSQHTILIMIYFIPLQYKRV